jgi:hypothetical protein
MIATPAASALFLLADGAGTETPPRHWNSIACVATAHPLHPAEASLSRLVDDLSTRVRGAKALLSTPRRLTRIDARGKIDVTLVVYRP